MPEDVYEAEAGDSATMSITAVEAITRGEIDIAIATAKRFPRNLSNFKAKAIATVTMSQEIAESCNYYLERTDRKTGEKKPIEGASIRLAEILVPLFGNARWAGRVIGADEGNVYAQGVFFDVENNVSVQEEVPRRITGSNGKRYGADMISVTGAAAKSIAMRNSALRSMPKQIVEEIRLAAKKTAMGDATTVAARWSRAMSFFKLLAVSELQLLKKLGREKVEEVTPEDIGKLNGLRTALKEGLTSVQDEFPPDAPAPASEGGAETNLEQAPLAPAPQSAGDKAAEKIEKKRGPKKTEKQAAPEDAGPSPRQQQLTHADLIARVRTAVGGKYDNGPAIDDAIRDASHGRFSDFNTVRMSQDLDALQHLVDALEAAPATQETPAAETPAAAPAKQAEDETTAWVAPEMQTLPSDPEAGTAYLRVLKGCEILALSQSRALKEIAFATSGAVNSLDALRSASVAELKQIHRHLLSIG